jgi:hypothetical protein
LGPYFGLELELVFLLFFVFVRTNELFLAPKIVQLGLKNPSSSSSLYFGFKLFAFLFCRNCRVTLDTINNLVEVVKLEREFS